MLCELAFSIFLRLAVASPARMTIGKYLRCRNSVAYLRWASTCGAVLVLLFSGYLRCRTPPPAIFFLFFLHMSFFCCNFAPQNVIHLMERFYGHAKFAT